MDAALFGGDGCIGLDGDDGTRATLVTWIGVVGAEVADVAGDVVGIAVGVGLAAAVDGARGIEDVGTIVDGVADAVAVVIVGIGHTAVQGAAADGVDGFGACGDAGGFFEGGFIGARREGVVQAVGGGLQGAEAFAGLTGRANLLRDTADIDDVAAGFEGADDGGVAVEGTAVFQHQGHIFGAAFDHRSEGTTVTSKDGEISAVSDGEGADGGVGVQGDGGVDGDHAPQLFAGEGDAVVRVVEVEGAAQLAQNVHGTRGQPVGAQGDVDAELLHDGDRRSLAVQGDVRARRPDQARPSFRHHSDVGGSQADAGDEGGVAVDGVFAAVCGR